MREATFHVDFGAVQPSRGDSLHKVAAYNGACRLTGPDGEFDFTRKAPEYAGGCIMAPPDAPPTLVGDRAALWSAALAAEKRRDGQPARLVEIMLPREVPPEQRLELVRAIVQPWVDEGAVAQLDLHCPPASDGDPRGQPHAHVILSRRALGADGFSSKKKLANEPWTKDRGRYMRAQVADRMNRWLGEYSVDVRVDHRSYRDRGDPTPPERDVGRRAFETWKKRPDEAVVYGDVLAARRPRRQLREARAELAQAEREIRILEQEHAHVAATAALQPRPNSHSDPREDGSRPPRHDGDPRIARGDRRGRRRGPDQPDSSGARRPVDQHGEPAREARRTRRLAAGVALARGPRRPGEDALAQARAALRQADGRAQRDAAQRACERSALAGPGRPGDDRLDAARRALAATMPPGLAPRHRAPRRRRRKRYNEAWLPAVGGPVVAVEQDRRDGIVIRLADGAAVIDHGDRLTLRGRPSDAALAAMADQAVRHGWTEVELTGADPVFRDRLAAALAARGVTVIGEPHPPSRVALQTAERYLAASRSASPGADKTARRPDDITMLSGRRAPTSPSQQPPTSPTAGTTARRHGEVTKSSSPQAPEPVPAAPAPAYVPPWVRSPGRRPADNKR
ncbi:MobA/MobL family protein [Roseomonas genomospecies 6]|nr:MobA/MobL family protein [Roseomonas genomospecies 6]